MGGLLAVSPARPEKARIGRRSVLKGAAALSLSAIGAPEPSWASAVPTAAASPVVGDPGSATPVPDGLIGYAFNAKTQDVTLFDPVTRQVLGTRPLGAVVRWLSNEHRYWDGRHIWTYDFPEEEVRAIAVDPWEVAVARALPTGGAGPAHSLMLTPDRTTAWVNVAGGDYLAVFDLATGEVTDEITTGSFP